MKVQPITGEPNPIVNIVQQGKPYQWIVMFDSGDWCTAMTINRAGGNYILTDDSRVIRMAGSRGARRWKILKGSLATTGYWEHRLYHNGKCCPVYLHRLIMETYFPCENSEKTEINHKDGDKLNNDPCNLEWVTPLQNMHHAKRTGLNKRNTSRLSIDQVHAIRLLRDCGMSSRKVASAFDVHHRSILDIWKNKSYRWIPWK